jgi:hypothetical protein
MNHSSPYPTPHSDNRPDSAKAGHPTDSAATEWLVSGTPGALHLGKNASFRLDALQQTLLQQGRGVSPVACHLDEFSTRRFSLGLEKWLDHPTEYNPPVVLYVTGQWDSVPDLDPKALHFLRTGEWTKTAHLQRREAVLSDVRKLKACVEAGVRVDRGRAVDDALYWFIQDDPESHYFPTPSERESHDPLLGKPYFVRPRLLEWLSNARPQVWPTAFSLFAHLETLSNAEEIVHWIENEVHTAAVPLFHPYRLRAVWADVTEEVLQRTGFSVVQA